MIPASDEIGPMKTSAISSLKWAPQGHVLFGSDFPYAQEPSVRRFTGSLHAYEIEEELRKVCLESVWVFISTAAEASLSWEVKAKCKPTSRKFPDVAGW